MKTLFRLIFNRSMSIRIGYEIKWLKLNTKMKTCQSMLLAVASLLSSCIVQDQDIDITDMVMEVVTGIVAINL
ncbi:hypothetical protein CS542_04950 [Pedobacter sp. IW39]|nr:hypothetical protein CS542_04950 [Pedobacter sp. IW39]